MQLDNLLTKQAENFRPANEKHFLTVLLRERFEKRLKVHDVQSVGHAPVRGELARTRIETQHHAYAIFSWQGALVHG